MKRILISSLIFATTLNIFALDVKYTGADKTEYHDHDYYELELDTVTKNPVWVKWTLTNVEAIESDASDNRTNDFRKCDYPDTKSATPQDYVKSSYDKGHNCPNNDRDWSKVSASATFYMCNMSPQTPNLNRGVWKKYEALGHTLAEKYGKVEIVSGPIFITAPMTIGKDVWVPNMFYKIFSYSDKIDVYVFTNSKDAQVRKISLEDLQKLVNIEIN